MNLSAGLTLPQQLILAWFLLTNVAAFVLFAWDKSRAGRPGKSRVSEFHLATIGAMGGWPGGLLAMLMLRHKTAKLSFKLKYTVALAIWVGGIYGALRWSV